MAVLGGVLDARKASLGEEHPAVTRTLVNLATVGSAINRTEIAKSAREELLKRAKATQATDYGFVADQLEQLAKSRTEGNDLTGALEAHQQVLEIRRRVLGEEHERTLAAFREHEALERRITNP